MHQWYVALQCIKSDSISQGGRTGTSYTQGIGLAASEQDLTMKINFILPYGLQK